MTLLAEAPDIEEAVPTIDLDALGDDEFEQALRQVLDRRAGRRRREAGVPRRGPPPGNPCPPWVPRHRGVGRLAGRGTARPVKTGRRPGRAGRRHPRGRRRGRLGSRVEDPGRAARRRPRPPRRGAGTAGGTGRRAVGSPAGPGRARGPVRPRDRAHRPAARLSAHPDRHRRNACGDGRCRGLRDRRDRRCGRSSTNWAFPSCRTNSGAPWRWWRSVATTSSSTRTPSANAPAGTPTPWSTSRLETLLAASGGSAHAGVRRGHLRRHRPAARLRRRHHPGHHRTPQRDPRHRPHQPQHPRPHRQSGDRPGPTLHPPRMHRPPLALRDPPHPALGPRRHHRPRQPPTALLAPPPTSNTNTTPRPTDDGPVRHERVASW